MADENKPATVAVVRLNYSDGTTEDVRLNPKVIVLAERHFKGQLPQVEGTLWAAWQRLGRPAASFDTWLDTIDDVIETMVEARPTSAAAGDAS